MKALIALPAVLAMAAPALAVDAGFGKQTLVRGEVYAVRACGDAFGPKTDVCYNQKTSGEVFPFSRGIGIEVERYRTVRVSCDAPRVWGTTRGDVAGKYCPQARAGVLAPAPFLR